MEVDTTETLQALNGLGEGRRQREIRDLVIERIASSGVS